MAMAGGMYGLTIQKFLNQSIAMTSGLDSETVVKTHLVTNAYTPNFDTDSFRTTSSANEPANSGTYAAGGVVITTTTLTVASPAATQIKYSAANPAAWTSATITARGCTTYHTTGSAATDELVVSNAFAADVSSSAGSFTLQFDATNGLFYIDYA